MTSNHRKIELRIPGQYPARLRSAFTVVELIVVIGIISVLIAILLPAVSLVHQQFQSAKCMSNLRQIGVAISNYAMDHENSLVPGDYFGLVDGSPTPGAGSWEDILTDGGYIHAPTGVVDTANRKESGFNGDYFRDNLFACPSGMQEDAADYNFPPTSQTDPLGSMFVARGSDITGTTVLSWYGCNMGIYQELYHGLDGLPLLPFKFVPDINPTTWTYDWTLNKVTKLKDTSHLPLVFDGVWCLWSMDNPNMINARHNNHTQTNILFADYHCEAQATSTLPNSNWYMK